MNRQLAVTVTSPGLFKERVSEETPGRVPLGLVVLLGLLSGRPIVRVCVCAHICVSVYNHSKRATGRQALIFLVHYQNEDLIVWFGLAGLLAYIQKQERSEGCYLSGYLK